MATGNLGSLDLAVDALGNAFVVYVNEDADAVKGRIRRPGAAGAWGGPETLSTGLSGVDDPHVAAGRDYEAFVAFTADNGGGGAARAVYSTNGDATPKACEDGIDNDGDGLIDHPADPGCSSPADDDESNPPAAGGGSSGVPVPVVTPAATSAPVSAVASKPATACRKASKQLASTNKQLKKAKKKLGKVKKLARKTKSRKAKAQFKKAKAQFKKAKKKSKRAKRAKSKACG